MILYPFVVTSSLSFKTLITLIDFDEVAVHNIQRKIGFSVGDEGQKKCEVLKNLIMSRCQFVEVESIDGSFDDFVSLNKSLKVDLILDATDNLPTRAKIDNYAKSKNIPWIYGSVEEFHGQVCFFDKASFESVFNVKERIPNGIACPIVMQIGSFQANLALKYLAGFAIKKDFLYYVFFNNDGEFTLQKFNLPI